MANLQGAYDNGAYQPGSIEPTAFDDLPAGDYPVIISDSEMKDTKNFDGQYLNLTLTIVDGQYKGRKLFNRLNLINRNATAVTIAKQQIESICRAVHFTEPLRDSSQLHHKPFVVRVSYAEKNRDGTDIPEGSRNDIKAYKPMPQSATFTMPQAAQTYNPVVTQQAAAQQAAAPQPPW